MHFSFVHLGSIVILVSRAGIPVAYLTFMVDPPEGGYSPEELDAYGKCCAGDTAFFYYMGLLYSDSVRLGFAFEFFCFVQASHILGAHGNLVCEPQPVPKGHSAPDKTRFATL